jgi:outer membrane lipoprotein LolB
MKQPGWRWSLILGVVVLSACSHLREHSAEVPVGWNQQVVKQSALTAWYVQGRLGVQTAKQAGSFDVFWNQQNDRYQIRLIAPMGQGAFLVDGDAHSVRLQAANGEISTAPSAEQLFKDSLGVDLPLESLQRWLRGVPAAGDSQLQWDKQGNLYLLKHGSWRVEMTHYRKLDGLKLPQAFYLSRADQPDLTVRLLLRHWQLKDLPALSL